MIERYTCTKEEPWSEDKGKALHPDAKYLHQEDDWYGGSYAHYECPNCKLKFEVELPD